MRMLAGLTGLVLVGLLAGCGGPTDDDAAPRTSSTPTTASASPSPTAAPVAQFDVCDLLSSADREELAGQKVDTTVPVNGPTKGYTCRYAGDDQAGGPLVQVQSLDAADWARDLPTLVQDLRDSGNPIAKKYSDDLERAEQALDRGEVSSSEACDIFVTIGEAGGGEKGATGTASVLELTSTLKAVSVQTCTEGQFTSVVHASAGITGSADEANAAYVTLRTAHQAALRLR